jgi:hypothetical protein
VVPGCDLAVFIATSRAESGDAVENAPYIYIYLKNTYGVHTKKNKKTIRYLLSPQKKDRGL